MALTGLGFAALSSLWPLLVAAFFGPLNPSGGDASIFLPLEYTMLAAATSPTNTIRCRAVGNLATFSQQRAKSSQYSAHRRGRSRCGGEEYSLGIRSVRRVGNRTSYAASQAAYEGVRFPSPAPAPARAGTAPCRPPRPARDSTQYAG